MIVKKAHVAAANLCAICADVIVERAYTEHHGALRRRLTAVTRDPATAEDIVQEAFLRLVIEIRAVGVPDNVGGWLWE